MSPTARPKAPMWSRWWAPTAGARCSTSRWTARGRSICAAISSSATRRSPRRGFISISLEAQLAGNAVGDALHRQGILIHAGWHQIACPPGEEQKDRVIGLVREAILRIAGGNQLSRLGGVAGGHEFRHALVLCGLEQRDFRHRH